MLSKMNRAFVMLEAAQALAFAILALGFGSHRLLIESAGDVVVIKDE